jgi:outer membrane protein assembly factor BamB
VKNFPLSLVGTSVNYWGMMKRDHLKRICCLSVLLATFTLTVDAEDWYRWRGPDLDGISRETDWSAKALSPDAKILWRANIGMGFSSFAVADGRVYATGNDADMDTVFCFAADTGKEIWKYSYAEPLGAHYFEGGTSATPTVDGDTVYQLSRKGHLAALDAKTGKVKWKKDIAKETGAKIPEWGFAGSPLVHGDMLVVNVGEHGTAVEKKTGKVVWTTGNGAAGYATAVPFKAAGKSGLAIFAGKELAAVDTLTGKLLWRYPWKTSYDVNAADPIFHEDQVFLSSGYGTGGGLVDIKGSTPKEVWANQNMHNQFNSSVLIDGHLYGISGQGGKSADAGLVCVELATGKLKWKESSLMFGAMTATKDKLIAIGEKGELVIADVNPEKFVAVSRAQVLGGRCWISPVLSNGRVYVRNAKGNMICVDVSK